MADFLLEILSEEIPARMQARARNDLARLFAQQAKAAGLATGPIDTLSTPRRLILIARDVAEATEASREEIKGPRSSAPPQALEGFLRKTGLTRDQLLDRDGVLFAVVERPGRGAPDVLAEAIKAIVADFPWPKSMRWGSGALRWVRPLQGIVALLGEEIVPVEIDGLASGATTVGHRFHHPGPITIGGAHDYAEKLRACHVIVDQDERERIVREGAETAAAGAGLQLLPDEGLVVENAGLTEWPVPLLGRFDPEYLDVPREVIVLTMRTNQKYFACTNDEGLLAPAFICTANIDASDGGAAIVEGNRRVLAARLSDARFFWEQDLKVPLEQQAKKLEDVLFHEKLGFVSDKVQRVAKLARWLVESGVVRGDPDQAEQAARLAKADLVTGMVGEFPELQGVIGGYLAEAQGEPKAVVEAVRQHYRPAGQNDEIPTEPISVAVSLADKLDSLLWFFMSDEIPTGSKDPYALRRSALGAISLVIHNGLRLSLSSSWRAQAAHNLEVLGPRILAETELLASENPAYKARLEAVERLENDPRLALRMLSFVEIERFPELQKMVPAIGAILKDEPGRLDTLQIFFADRLKVQQREAGVRHDLIDAVFSLGGEDDLVRLLARVTALQDFVETGEGRDLLTAYKRAANILKKENFTGPEVLSSREEQGIPQTGEEDPLVLVEEPGMAEAIAEMASGAAGAELPEEHALIAALDGAEPKALAAVQAEDFTGAMAALATLRGPIDAFFDKVTVNDPVPEKRERRLNLLLRFRDAVNAVADFSKIEA